jgi:Uma2 family endonuclease
VRVRIQNSIGIPALTSVPEPDVAWVKRRNYMKRRPHGEDVLLLIEVAESSLRFDTGKKARLYAATRIADYWVVDVKNEAVLVFRDPVENEYRVKEAYRGDELVQPLAWQELALRPADLFAIETYDD